MEGQDKKRYILKEDIKSGKNKLYGKKRERVIEVAVHDDVLIVEKEDGERFPVHISKLLEY